jgi:hypothetical protein
MTLHLDRHHISRLDRVNPMCGVPLKSVLLTVLWASTTGLHINELHVKLVGSAPWVVNSSSNFHIGDCPSVRQIHCFLSVLLFDIWLVGYFVCRFDDLLVCWFQQVA